MRICLYIYMFIYKFLLSGRSPARSPDRCPLPSGVDLIFYFYFFGIFIGYYVLPTLLARIYIYKLSMLVALVARCPTLPAARCTIFWRSGLLPEEFVPLTTRVSILVGFLPVGLFFYL